MTTKWPDEVTVVETGMVGELSLTQNGKPCCALGWAGYDLFGNASHFAQHMPMDGGSEPDTTGFVRTYQKVADADGCTGRNFRSTNDVRNVADINDRCTKQKRALYYNAAMAALGYVVGNTRAAIALARKAGFKV